MTETLSSKPTFIILSSDSEEELTQDGKNSSKKHPTKKRTVRVRSAPLSLDRDFGGLIFPDTIKEKACQIAERERFEPRKSRQKVKMMYMCIRYAYAECGLLCDPQKIAEELNMTRKEVNSAETTYNEATTGYAPPEIGNLAENWIATYLGKILIDDSYLEILIKLLSQLLQKDPDLRNIKPEDLAAATIIYCFRIKHILRKPDEIKDLIIRLDRPVTIVNSLVKRLETLHNDE